MRQELSAVNKLNHDRNQRINNQLVNVIRTLNSVDIQPLVLKGASYLLEPVSQIHCARMMSDIDILIDENSMSEAIDVLKKTDYVFSNFLPEGTDYHLDSMIQNGMPVRVELHRHPLSKAGGQLLPTDEAWNNVRFIENEALNYYIFSPEYRLIHQFLHAEVHSRDYANMRLDLRQLYDFYLMCMAYATIIDWTRVNKRFDNTPYKQAWINYVLISKSLFPNLKYPPIQATIEQHLNSRKRIAKLTGSDNKEFAYHSLERLTRLPTRMRSLSWYLTKLDSLFRSP